MMFSLPERVSSRQYIWRHFLCAIFRSIVGDLTVEITEVNRSSCRVFCRKNDIKIALYTNEGFNRRLQITE